MGFFAKTLGNQMSKESLGDGRSSITDTVKAGISSVPFLRKMQSREVSGILPGQVGDVHDLDLQDTALSEEGSQTSLLSHHSGLDMADAGVQADAKGVEVSNVGIQCYLRSYNFNSAAQVTHRRSIS